MNQHIRHSKERRNMRKNFKKMVAKAQDFTGETDPSTAMALVALEGVNEIVEIVAEQEDIPREEWDTLDNVAILVAEHTAQSIAALLDTKGREPAFHALLSIVFSAEYSLTGTPYAKTLMRRPPHFVEDASAHLAQQVAHDTIDEMEAFLKESHNE